MVKGEGDSCASSDWLDWIKEVRFEGVAPYLTKVFEQGGVRLACMGWRRLVRLQESVYKELCVDFFAIAKFIKRNEDNDTRNFTFCLGGRRQEYSLVELTWRLDLRNQFEALSEGFPISIYLSLPQKFSSCHCRFQAVDHHNEWKLYYRFYLRRVHPFTNSHIHPPIDHILHQSKEGGTPYF